MNATFLLTLDVSSDTDLLSIAEDLKDIIETHSDHLVSESKPWHRETFSLDSQSPGIQLPPPPQQPML